MMFVVAVLVSPVIYQQRMSPPVRAWHVICQQHILHEIGLVPTKPTMEATVQREAVEITLEVVTDETILEATEEATSVYFLVCDRRT